MKLCKDCKWCNYAVIDNGKYSKCYNEDFLPISPITGRVEGEYCINLRVKHGKCYDAIHFQEKDKDDE